MLQQKYCAAKSSEHEVNDIISVLLGGEAFRLITCVLCVGIDSEGHAANYVETEQIVQYSGAKASFVQVSYSSDTTREM